MDDPAVNNLRTLPEAIRMLRAERDALLSLIADDAFASSFQTMAQYRSALLLRLGRASRNATHAL